MNAEFVRKKRSQRRNYRLICNGFQQKKVAGQKADIRMIHEMSSAQNALDHLKDYCSNSWTTKPRVQCRLFNRVLKRWTAQLISVIFFRWIVIYPVDSAIQPVGGGVLPYQRPVGMCAGWGRIFTTGLTIMHGVASSIEFTRMASHIFGFWGWESCSYLRLANVPEYLYCRWKVKCSSFNLFKNGSINFRMTYLKDW